MGELKPGEKYLRIQLFGKDGVKVAAFKNERFVEGGTQPAFKGDGIAVWVCKKKAPIQEVPLDDSEFAI